MWHSFKMWKHGYIGMYPHCMDTRFLNILMYPHCHHHIEMYPHFPGIGYLSMLKYPHCRFCIGVYPHCLDSRFLSKLMYSHCLVYIEMYPSCLYIGMYPHCLDYKNALFCLGGNTDGIRVILKQLCNGPKCPFTAGIYLAFCTRHLNQTSTTYLHKMVADETDFNPRLLWKATRSLISVIPEYFWSRQKYRRDVLVFIHDVSTFLPLYM